MWGISTKPFIQECNFISCSANDDGGGLSIWQSSGVEQVVCKDSFFVNCDGGDDGDGGGFALWWNSAMLPASNIVFSFNKAKDGGAYSTDFKSSNPKFPLLFCFFHCNTAPNGNDIYINELPSYCPCLLCFTTSPSKQIGYYDGNRLTSAERDWLPQTNSIIKVFDPRTITNQISILKNVYAHNVEYDLL